jgi:hypothetical protein
MFILTLRMFGLILIKFGVENFHIMPSINSTFREDRCMTAISEYMKCYPYLRYFLSDFDKI